MVEPVELPAMNGAQEQSWHALMDLYERVSSDWALIGALVGKAAARTEVPSDRVSVRHCTDFVALANLISARDFRETELVNKDRSRLRKMVALCRSSDSAMTLENAAEALDRLERAARLSG